MAKKNGRPSTFTPERVEEILLHIENGATYRRACILVGISEATFHEWKAQGKKALEDEKPNKFSEFLEKVNQAKEKYIAWLQSLVNQGAKMDGKLALRVLERKRPEEFGRKDTLSIKGNFNVSKFDVELTPEQEAEYKERLADMYGKEE